ncbi:hypothetical protein O181_014460 [Austropuccinia psidii MF-1]|uniref:GATA-type domain-containing protein n=1 Tax=Austropuccinia psidii MF-1 TaxID=1389203 RepID=A0A9Q3GPY0_9BASI|nr:hypothetical protein [Austropuccinia psidii MF-1]
MSKHSSNKIFLLQLKLFSQVTDVESLSQTWKLCTKLERERHLRLTQLEAPLWRKNHPVDKPVPTVSAKLHHPTVVCSLSSPITDMGKGLVNCTAITTSTHISFSPSPVWDFSLKAASINFESFLANFSPPPAIGAVDYASHESFKLNENDPGSNSSGSTIAFQSLEGLDGLEYPDAILGKGYNWNSFLEEIRTPSQLEMDSSSKGSILETIGITMSEPSAFNYWPEAIDLPIEPAPESKALSDNFVVQHRADHLSMSAQASLSKGKLQLSERQLDRNIPHSTGSSSFSVGITLKGESFPVVKRQKLTEKRKRRNPMATRPPTFIGLPATPGPADDVSNEPICFNCSGTQTPLWRRGPNDELLCNACAYAMIFKTLFTVLKANSSSGTVTSCGVFYKVHKKHRPATLTKFRYAGKSSNINKGSTLTSKVIKCTNCNATATPMWRKAPDGHLLCNACALYYKCHQRPRPANSKRSPGGQSMDSVGSLTSASYTNKSYLLGMTPSSSILCDASFGSPNVPNSTFINNFGQTFNGTTPLCNELPKLDLFKSYSIPFYASRSV